MLDILQALIIINLGLIFVVLDIIGAAVMGEWILDRIRPEGQSTSLEEDE